MEAVAGWRLAECLDLVLVLMEDLAVLVPMVQVVALDPMVLLASLQKEASFQVAEDLDLVVLVLQVLVLGFHR